MGRIFVPVPMCVKTSNRIGKVLDYRNTLWKKSQDNINYATGYYISDYRITRSKISSMGREKIRRKRKFSDRTQLNGGVVFNKSKYYANLSIRRHNKPRWGLRY